MLNKQMILFDMDGTLLPMDIDEFTEGYFKLLLKKFVPMGYDKDLLVKAVWAGTHEMYNNNGVRPNVDRFWDEFSYVMGKDMLEEKPIFDCFYENEFDGVKDFCGYNPEVRELVEKVRAAGFRTAVATNPIFPLVAMRKRLEWAGLDPDGFELITAYENSRYCKPNPAYFADTAARLGVDPEWCLMVGNDATEDLACDKIGMDVFILTDHLLNRDNVDISEFPHGNLKDLEKYIFD